MASKDKNNVVELENLTLDEFDDLLNAASQPSYRSTNRSTGAHSEKVDRALKSLREQADSERRQADDESEMSFTNHSVVSNGKSVLKIIAPSKSGFHEVPAKSCENGVLYVLTELRATTPPYTSEPKVESVSQDAMVANKDIANEIETNDSAHSEGRTQLLESERPESNGEQQDLASTNDDDSGANGVIEIVRSTRRDGFGRNSSATVSELVNLVDISRIDKNKYLDDELPTFSIETLQADKKLHSVREALSVDLTELDGPYQLSLRSVKHSLSDQEQVTDGDMTVAIPYGGTPAMDAQLTSRLARKKLERQKRMASCTTSEQVEGYCGYLSVESLLKFIGKESGDKMEDQEEIAESSGKEGNLRKVQRLKGPKEKKKQAKKQAGTDNPAGTCSDAVVESSLATVTDTSEVPAVVPLEEKKLTVEDGGSSCDVRTCLPEDNDEFIPVKSRRAAKSNKEGGRHPNRPVRSTTPPGTGKNRCALFRRRSSVDDGRRNAKNLKPLGNPVRSCRYTAEFDTTKMRCRNVYENGEPGGPVATCSSPKGAVSAPSLTGGRNAQRRTVNSAGRRDSSADAKCRVSINSHASFPSLNDLNSIGKEGAATSSDRPGKVYDSLCLEETSRVRPMTTYASVTSGFPPVSFGFQRRRPSDFCNGETTTLATVGQWPNEKSARNFPGSGALPRSQSIPVNGAVSKTTARRENAHFPVDGSASMSRGSIVAHSVNNGIDRSTSGKRPVQFFDRSPKNASGVRVQLSFGFDVEELISGSGGRSENVDRKSSGPAAEADLIENAHLVSQDGYANSAVVSPSETQDDATVVECQNIYVPTEADKKLCAFLKQEEENNVALALADLCPRAYNPFASVLFRQVKLLNLVGSIFNTHTLDLRQVRWSCIVYCLYDAAMNIRLVYFQRFHSSMDKKHFEKLESKIDAFLHCGDWTSAVFWAERLLLCKMDDAYAIYTFVRCLYMAGEYGRALLYMERRQLTEGHELFRFLAAQCKLAKRLPGDVINLLQHSSDETAKTRVCRRKARCNLKRLSLLDELAVNLNIAGQKSLLLGKALQMIEDTKEAVEAYKRALQDDVMIADAASRLFLDHFVTPRDKEEIFQSIQSCIEMQKAINPKLLNFFYSLMLRGPPNDLQEYVSTKFPCLEDSSPVRFQKARDHYNYGNFDSALAELDQDALTNEHDSRVLALRCCSLLLSGREALLFKLAHELSLYMSDQPITYFAIGCYYYIVESYDTAKQFFRKSAKIDLMNCYAWIAYGNACATDIEHDQAMNSYLRANTLMLGHPFPMTLIGVEYTVTGHFALAQNYLSDALDLAPYNPYTVHEMGVLLLKMGKYRTAETYFLRAIQQVKRAEKRLPVYWEPLINNLGHCYRKMRMYDKALKQFEEALELVPCNPSTLISIAFIHMLSRDSWGAVRYLREALIINPENSVAKKLINRALENSSVAGITYGITECEPVAGVTGRELDYLLSCFEE